QSSDQRWGLNSSAVVDPNNPNSFWLSGEYVANAWWQTAVAQVAIGGGTAMPTASLSASPTSITSGQSSTLTWSSTNATSCTGTGFSTGGATSGSASVSPTVTTTYSVSCTGSSGTRRRTRRSQLPSPLPTRFQAAAPYQSSPAAPCRKPSPPRSPPARRNPFLIASLVCRAALRSHSRHARPSARAAAPSQPVHPLPRALTPSP